MGAYKQFTTKDVTITPFDVSKRFYYSGNAITASDVGIEVYAGQNPAPTISPTLPESIPTGFVSIQNTRGVYNNIKQLYYSNYQTSSIGDNIPLPIFIPGATPSEDRYVGQVIAPRFENYLQSTLTQSRYFPTGIGSDGDISVVSIPAKLFGENIVPSTFELTYTSSGDLGFHIVDDGDGNLIINSVTGSSGYGAGAYGTMLYGDEGGTVGQIVGQIFYSHGIAVFTTSSLSSLGVEMSASLSNLANLEIGFSSSLRIYEQQYKCVINENEFGYSLNPSLLSGSLDDTYYDFATGSLFTPYVTTVGLYNESNELLLVGKLSFPLQLSQYTDTTIIINFDV